MRNSGWHVMGAALAGALAVTGLLVWSGAAQHTRGVAPGPAPACDDPHAADWYLPLPANAVEPLDAPEALFDTAQWADPQAQERRATQAARDLAKVGEPSLRCGPAQVPAYRFVWIPSFQPALVIRVYRDEHGGKRIVARSAGELRAGPPLPAGMVDAPPQVPWRCPAPRALSSAQWRQVVEAFARLPADDSMSGLDGDTWMLESLQQGRHRWIEHWQPQSPQIRAAGRVLVELSGCTVPMARFD